MVLYQVELMDLGSNIVAHQNTPIVEIYRARSKKHGVPGVLTASLASDGDCKKEFLVI